MHEGFRVPVTPPGDQIRLNLRTAPPADAAISWRYHVEVPAASEAGEEVLIVRSQDGERVRSASISKLVSAGVTPLFRLGLDTVAERQIEAALSELYKAAERSLRSKGY